MAEVIEFKKSGGCDWEDHFYPLNQKLNVNYAGRYVREADYLALQSQRDELLEALKAYTGKFGDCGTVYESATAAIRRVEGK